MKLKKIVVNDISEWHPSSIPSPTDTFYQQLANRLQKTFASLPFPEGTLPVDVIRAAAVRLTNYMEDIVADSGIWNAFSSLCQEMYGHPVPVFHEEEDYYPDEPSRNAVCFILWTVFVEEIEGVAIADSPVLRLMADSAYDILNEVFEESPVNSQLQEHIMDLLESASEGFFQMRDVLDWLFLCSYLYGVKHNKELFLQASDEFLDLCETGDLDDVPDDMPSYYATAKCCFSHRIGPLALFPKDYLAAMMRVKGMDGLAADVAGIETMAYGIYRKENKASLLTLVQNSAGGERVRLTRTDGRQVEMEAEEFCTVVSMSAKETDVFMIPSLVSYMGEWHINGIVLPFESTDRQWKDFCKEDPTSMKRGEKTYNADMMLKRTGGKRLIYLADKKELEAYLTGTLRLPADSLRFIDKGYDDHPVIYIDTETPKHCLQIFYGYAECIADPANPYYDADEAKASAIDILWADGIMTNAVNYMLEHGFLPDIYNDSIFANGSTKEEKRKDTDFVMRCCRCEKF